MFHCIHSLGLYQSAKAGVQGRMIGTPQAGQSINAETPGSRAA